jgi:TetR/AcrR family transcriptional regulator, transcriptional repressor for nem operon
MTKTAIDKRQRLIESAVRLAHEGGLARASLAEIAKAAHVPLGNVYYYFKKRDDIALAIVKWHANRQVAVLARLDGLSTPRQRLIGYINARSAERDQLALHGCAIGGLCSELRHESWSLSQAANTLLARPLSWAEAQFRKLGQGRESRSSALHLMSSLQGAAVLAHGQNDADLMKSEAALLRQWVLSI